MRVVICEDHALLRDGIIALLREAGQDVVGHTDTGDGLLALVAEHHPDLAIVDIRLPPTFRDEGIRAALAARKLQPGLGVLILSQYIEPVYSAELLDSGPGGVGYLLKERVGDVAGFLDAAHRVAAGGTALDREVVSELLFVAPREARNRGGGTARLDSLSRREREVLALMAEGRSNLAIGQSTGHRPRRRREAHLQHLQQTGPHRHRRGPSPCAGSRGLPTRDYLTPPRSSRDSNVGSEDPVAARECNGSSGSNSVICRVACRYARSHAADGAMPAHGSSIRGWRKLWTRLRPAG